MRLRGVAMVLEGFQRDVAAVRAACEAGWEWLRAMPERIASILRGEWAAVAEAAR